MEVVAQVMGLFKQTEEVQDHQILVLEELDPGRALELVKLTLEGHQEVKLLEWE